jgi:hypothetical protein
MLTGGEHVFYDYRFYTYIGLCVHVPPLIRPFKGMNKDIQVNFSNCDITFRVFKLRFLAFPRGPGGFRELREAGRNNFHLSWHL